MPVMPELIKKFREIHSSDLPLVGGKNSSLGELYNELSTAGIQVPDGFATTASAFWYFIDENGLRPKLKTLLAELDSKQYSNLKAIGLAARKLILEAVIPVQLEEAIAGAYSELCGQTDREVAVRSSASAEDLPQASFAGQHESYLNIKGKAAVVAAIKRCYASLFTDRAIKYREDNHFDHLTIALSAGVMNMVRSDLASSGICFTLEPESGFRDIIHISGSWGLGENIVQGSITPDEYYIFKPTLLQNKNAIIQKKLGEKSLTMVYCEAGADGATTINLETPATRREQYVLSDAEILQLAQWALVIEKHYGRPMDIEWAKDGLQNKIYIVQARPETVKSNENPLKVKEYKMLEKADILVRGESVGSKIVSGIARVLHSPKDIDKINKGEIVITEITSPDWDPVLKKSGGIITDKGGRTSHASIVARELDVPALVGTYEATQRIKDGQFITLDCSEGRTGFVYSGKLKWKENEYDFSNIQMPTRTGVMLIVGDPAKAFKLSFYPNNGIGLMRIEFIINQYVRIHPMALVKYDELTDTDAKQEIEKLTHHYPDKPRYFVEKLAQGVATIAAAFYPKEVIVRMSDFKTNEYANLLGGKQFEPHEENPMLGFRGASRYYNPLYKDGFRLECEAMKMVRDDMGLTNVKLMIPFCRTVEEGKRVIDVMKQYGLKQKKNELEIYVMAEIPSNVIQAEEFGAIFDGFSIGSNDLTQLTLGIDRDSAIIANLFSEQNKSAKAMMAMVIGKAKKMHKKIGLCGQAPSDFPEFAQFLVEQGINSISFSPDAMLKGIQNINNAEKKNPTSLY